MSSLCVVICVFAPMRTAAGHWSIISMCMSGSQASLPTCIEGMLMGVKSWCAKLSTCDNLCNRDIATATNVWIRSIVYTCPVIAPALTHAHPSSVRGQSLPKDRLRRRTVEHISRDCRLTSNHLNYATLPHPTNTPFKRTQADSRRGRLRFSDATRQRNTSRPPFRPTHSSPAPDQLQAHAHDDVPHPVMHALCARLRLSSAIQR